MVSKSRSSESWLDETSATRNRPGLCSVAQFSFHRPQGEIYLGNDPKAYAAAVPFDVFQAFGHHQDHYTRGTICRRFGSNNKPCV